MQPSDTYERLTAEFYRNFSVYLFYSLGLSVSVKCDSYFRLTVGHCSNCAVYRLFLGLTVNT